MPTARYTPQAKPQTPSLPPTPYIPEPRVDPMKVAAAVTQPLRELEGITEQASRKAMESAALDLAARNAKRVTDLIDAGQKRLGKDAETAKEELMDEYENQVSEDAKGISGDLLKAAYDRDVTDKRLTLYSALKSHADRESKKADDANIAGAIDNAANVTAMTADIPEEVAKQRRNTAALTAGRLRKRGVPAEDPAHRAEMTGELSKFWTVAVAGAITKKRPDLARLYAETAARKGELTAADNERIDGMMERTRRALEDEQYLTAANMVDRNPGVDPKLVVPKDLWETLDPAKRDALANHAEAPAYNDSNRWLDFMAMGADAMGKLSKTQYDVNYRSKFDKEHQTRADGMYEAAMKQAQTGMKNPQLTATLTFKDQIDNTFRTMKIINPKATAKQLSADEKRFIDGFELQASEALEEYERGKGEGKKASMKERQQIIDDLLMQTPYLKARVSKPGFDPLKPVADLTAEERKAAYFPLDKIPPLDLAEMKRRMGKSLGREPSDMELQRGYFALKSGDLDLYRAIAGIKR